ncbi:cystathione beta-lyase [Austwickia chelonae]|uniref:cysteine-S-conjugate beta-lyase n=1 Tax=Austwickia chelonae NBRC 105200 TaxID=1184607 RepID=K6WA49_9MICO|nr:aminotransferase class I/II-fold pyridoxal phosphate-dependent enzyme [Austwickia chelonae]GAB78712.1 putative aminotransferase [Austwickia chelonae NBRC 105200]SEW34943.1 cystathione beta-lyase [Austwickia chelonae]
MAIITLTPDEMRARNTLKWTRYAPDVLPLWVAEMDIRTCPAVQDAIASAVGRQTYGYPSGDSRLAEATADWCARRYAWQVDPGLVHAVPDVLVGVRAAIDHFTTPGSPIVLPVPAYMPFFDVLDVCGRRGVFTSMLVEDCPDGGTAHRFDLAAIEAAFAAGAGGIILCNPYNPLGAVFPAWHLAEVCELAARYGARVVSDEIHAPLVYGRRHIPTASVSRAAAEVTVTVLASSKGFNTPGLKCAQVVLSNDADARRWSQVHRMRYEGVSTLGVEASVAAYRDGAEWLDELLVFLAGNRDHLARTLPEVVPGLRWAPPQATFLAWLDFSGVAALGGADPSAWLLERAKVFLNPGPAFGPGGQHHARLNFGTSRDILEEFVSRLGGAVGSR